MAGPKFFVYGGCRWREIDTTSGRVVGWGNVQFLTVHRGRLQVARKNSVLRGLRSLAASKPTSVHDGAPLSQIRHNNVIEKKKKKEHECIQYQQHHCCCRQQDLRYNSDVIFNNLLKAATSTAAVQCSIAEVIKPNPTKSTSVSTKSHSSTVINYNQNQVKRLLAKRKRSTSEDEKQMSRMSKSARSSSSESNLKINTPLINRKITQDSLNKAPFHTVSNHKYDKTKLRKSTISQKLSSSDDETEEVLTKVSKSQRRNLESRTGVLERSRPRELLKETPVNYNKYDKSKLRKVPPQKLTNVKDETQKVVSKKLNKSPRKDKEHHVESHTHFSERNTRNSLKNSSKHTINREKYENQNALNRSKRKLSISEDEFKENRKASKFAKNRSDESDQDLGIPLTQRKQTQELDNGDLCKELLIGEEDILLLRTFIENDEANIFDVDLERFDADDTYKGMIFYKLNPLVNIARCKKIAAMLREQRSQSNAVSFEDFISTLGLRSVLDSSSQTSSKYKMRPRRTLDKQTQHHTSESELDKENYKKSQRDRSITSRNKVLAESLRDSGNKKNRVISKKNIKKHAVGLVGKMSSKPMRSKKVDRAEVVSLSSDSDSVFEKSKTVTEEIKQLKPTVVLKRDVETGGRVSGRSSGRVSGRSGGRVSGKMGGREYTRAEDEAVVSWVRGAGRARRVNGNQLWRELQPLHQQRTGHFRSWHSLRNRYLRYLLPALASLALPPAEAVRLRADAAAGELKSRKKPQRRNSLLSQPRVRSAWAGRPRPPRESPPPSPSHSHSHSHSPSPLRTPSPPDSTDTSSSTMSRDSIRDRRSTLRRKTTVTPVSNEGKPSRQLRSSDARSPHTHKDSPVPTYSQLTRRFADKPDVTPDRLNRQTDTQDRPRTRRLYNPNAM